MSQEQNLVIGIKLLVSHMPEILFVESIKFENVASLMVQEEGEVITHRLEKLKWVRQMRLPDVVVITCSSPICPLCSNSMVDTFVIHSI